MFRVWLWDKKKDQRSGNMEVTEGKKRRPQEMEGIFARGNLRRQEKSRLKEKVGNDKVFACEKHFHPENIETCK